jgi:geranylgeranyl diphosphate synthase, type II
MAGNFLHELEKLKRPVWKKIQQHLPKKYPQVHYQMVRDYPERMGKYLRPGLLLLSTKMFGGSQEKAVSLAAAMQLSEEWLLIHDDIEDHSEYRRSKPGIPKPTLHKIYGEELAINAGDALHTLMWRMLGDYVFSVEKPLGLDIYNRMSQIILTTIEGQYIELSWIKEEKTDISETEYFKMVYRKTANYSIIGPIQLGAMAAGHTSRQALTTIQHWATPLGYAFQVKDDLLNLTQQSEVMGKEQGGDILEGKRTLMLIHLLKNCSRKDKAFVTAVYRKPRAEKSEQEKMQIIEMMDNKGSLRYAENWVNKLCRKAKMNLRTTPYRTNQHIHEFIEFINSRSY